MTRRSHRVTNQSSPIRGFYRLRSVGPNSKVFAVYFYKKSSREHGCFRRRQQHELTRRQKFTLLSSRTITLGKNVLNLCFIYIFHHFLAYDKLKSFYLWRAAIFRKFRLLHRQRETERFYRLLPRCAWVQTEKFKVSSKRLNRISHVVLCTTEAEVKRHKIGFCIRAS